MSDDVPRPDVPPAPLGKSHHWQMVDGEWKHIGTVDVPPLAYPTEPRATGGTDWRALADDLAAVLERLDFIDPDGTDDHDVQAVLARYREARQ